MQAVGQPVLCAVLSRTHQKQKGRGKTKLLQNYVTCLWLLQRQRWMYKPKGAPSACTLAGLTGTPIATHALPRGAAHTMR